MPSMHPSTTAHPLATRYLLAWFLVGVVLAVFLQWIQVRSLGGDWTGLVDTGQQSALRPSSKIVAGSLLLAAVVPSFVRSALMRWLTWPRVVLALVSSGWVWDLGNNSLRVFAPLLTLAVLGLAILAGQRAQLEVPA